ncbi:MAG: hypothetical protein ACI35W_00265 [Anaeroplasmataceae bacterium]
MVKTKVFGIVIWIASILCIADGTILSLVILSGQKLEIYIWIMIILMMCVLPIGVFIMALLMFNNTIIIDDNGVSRIRFKKIIRFFQWEDIKTIGFTSEDSFTGWCYISIKPNIKYGYTEVTKMRLDKDVIYFHLTDKNTFNLKKILKEKGIKY